MVLKESLINPVGVVQWRLDVADITTDETAKKQVSEVLQLLRNRRDINPVEFG